MGIALEKFILMLLILVFSAAAGATSNWQVTEVPGVDRAWALDRSAQDLVTYVKSVGPQNLSFEGASQQDIASGIIGFRFLPLQTLGFTKFTITEFKVQAENGVYRVQMAGSYVTPAQAKVHFFERQTYRGKNFSQVSYFIENRRVSAADAAQAEEVVKSFESTIQREPASLDVPVPDTEANAICTECLELELGLKDLKSQTEALKASVGTLTPPAENCKVNNSILIDPKKNSILEDLGFKNDSENPIVNVGRASLACIYGAGKGVYGSLKDLVTAIPTLLGWTWKGLKAAKNGIQNADYGAIMDKFTPQNIWESGKKAVRVTRETVSSAYEKSSQVLFDSYKEGGVTGSVATVAQAAYNSSPHRVVGKFLADIGAKIAEAVAAEWGAFKCLDAETMSQMICNVAGYIATDIYTGGLIISGLSKSAKLKEAVSLAKAMMFKKAGTAKAAVVAEEKARSLETIAKSVAEMKTSVSAEKGVVEASRETLASAEKVAEKISGKSSLNTGVIEEALDEAKLTGSTDALETLKKAYASLHEVSAGEGKLTSKSLKTWEKNLKKERPDLTDSQISRARECLFQGGK